MDFVSCFITIIRLDVTSSLLRIVQWSRLIGGINKTPMKKHVNLTNPQQRLAHFKRIYNNLLVKYQPMPSF